MVFCNVRNDNLIEDRNTLIKNICIYFAQFCFLTKGNVNEKLLFNRNSKFTTQLKNSSKRKMK